VNSIGVIYILIISHELKEGVDGSCKLSSIQSDGALREIYEKRGITKWEEISRILDK